MHIEIETLVALRSHFESGKGWRDVVVQGLDLTRDTALLMLSSVDGAAFIGCAFEPAALTHVIATGGIVFPRLPHLPWDSSRASLYTVDELMKGTVDGDERSFFVHSTDAKIYARYQASRAQPPIIEALAQRLHDHAIDDALGDLLERIASGTRGVVAFMGGHALARTESAWADVVKCARALARAGYFIITGGGPGAMEAANLGAYLVNVEDAFVVDVIAHLREAPTYKSPGWIATADAIRKRIATNGARVGESLGVPTWFYGHEPTNLFCTHVAKYFSNAIREDGLLAIARAGVVFAPGGPGTIQEVFMDACQNHYGTYDDVSPMVFLGVDFWTKQKPVYPLLEQLAKGAQYAELLACVDTVDDVVDFIRARPPVKYVKR